MRVITLPLIIPPTTYTRVSKRQEMSQPLITLTSCPFLDDPIELLPFAAQATFDSSGTEDDSDCLPNTRVDVLQQIRTWADGDDERYIF